jgi:hypothetical protein
VVDITPHKKKVHSDIDIIPSLISIPVSVLSDRSVATLEAVVEYLKEVLGLSYHEIAVLLNRDDRTVWTCYQRAKKKRSKNG